MGQTDSGFSEHRKHILAELVRLSSNLDKLQSVTTSLAVEVGGLKATNAVKAGFWGSIGGTLGAVILMVLLKGVFK